MTRSGGDGGEMRDPDHLPTVDEVDRLLDGHLPAGDAASWSSLSGQLDDLRAAYQQPADGLDVDRLAARAATDVRLIRSDKGDPAATSASNADRPASQVSGLPKTRRQKMIAGFLAFLATTAGKATMAAAVLAAATTGGMAATGNLPGVDRGDTAVVVASADDLADQSGAVDDDAHEDACEGLGDIEQAQCEADLECAEAQADAADADEADRDEAQREAEEECAEAQAEIAEAEAEAAEEATESAEEAGETDDDDADDAREAEEDAAEDAHEAEEERLEADDDADDEAREAAEDAAEDAHEAEEERLEADEDAAEEAREAAEAAESEDDDDDEESDDDEPEDDDDEPEDDDESDDDQDDQDD